MIDSYEYKGYTIEVHQYEHPPNPRTEWDNLSTMVCWHRRYELGDEQPRTDPDTYLEDLACSLDDSLEERLYYWEDGNGWSQLLNQNPDAAIDEIETNFFSPGFDVVIAFRILSVPRLLTLSNSEKSSVFVNPALFIT